MHNKYKKPSVVQQPSSSSEDNNSDSPADEVLDEFSATEELSDISIGEWECSFLDLKSVLLNS